MIVRPTYPYTQVVCSSREISKPRIAFKIEQKQSDGALSRSESSKSEVGALGEYLRGKKPLRRKKFVIAYCLFLSSIAWGIVAKAWGF